tara:strand:- start:1332 stop:1976 length:645 start_codon:yes stop_codon:yes gene_type:complete
MENNKNKFYGDAANHKWITRSICRHLLYEGCDLKGELNRVGKVYAHHLNKRQHGNFANHEHRRRAVNILLEFYDYMSDEITIFPMFGTLLGIVREQDLILHDDDLDFGYFKKDSERLIKKLDNLHNKDGYLVIRNEFSNLYSLVKDGIMIDLYEYEVIEEENLLQQGHRTFYNLQYDEALPLKTIEFADRELVSINNPIAFFERYYGKDWKTPK